jgi:hypothetical protein
MLTSYLLSLVAAVGLAVVEQPTAPAAGITATDHQVVAIYFHRTVRCPTCKKIGGLAEEAVNKGFAEQLANGSVEFRYVDFQDEKNAELTKAYKITGPTMVLLDVVDGRVTRWAPLPKVWQLVAKPQELQTYVQTSVAQYLLPAGTQTE